MSVSSPDSVTLLAFSLWAAFQLHLEQPLCRDRRIIWVWLVRFPGNNRSRVDPVPNEGLLGELMNFL